MSQKKMDIIQDVIGYIRHWNRHYRAVSSHKRRYKAVCTRDDCSFVVQVDFSQNFCPPTTFALHSCQVSGSFKASRRYVTAKHITINPAVSDMAMNLGRNVTLVII